MTVGQVGVMTSGGQGQFDDVSLRTSAVGDGGLKLLSVGFAGNQAGNGKTIAETPAKGHHGKQGAGKVKAAVPSGPRGAKHGARSAAKPKVKIQHNAGAGAAKFGFHLDTATVRSTNAAAHHAIDAAIHVLDATQSPRRK